eukprot:TRINITY_DN39213_c0_g1_i1.p1 TRINITY_DN39213_c0_g1~~TRINITY_DN39213_c0_g1_i1.p1  ORF type:complete len:713 (+),score=258.60 TRINITY_DN39213_c0_g1_i1:56-2194(+)
MAAAEFQAFQEEQFDPRQWINGALRGTKQAELEQQVNQLQMQLQLFSTSVNGTFEDQVMKSLAHFPTCMITLDKMSREVGHLTHTLNALLTPEALQRQAKAEQSVRALQDLHKTRTKLDVCRETLVQTVYLRNNRTTVDQAFHRGATEEAAAEIAKMRKALDSIRAFDHHDQLAAEIATHEKRLQGMVESECVEALIGHDVQRAQKHMGMLNQIGRMQDVLRTYIDRVSEPLLAKWGQIAGIEREEFVSQLPEWHQELQSLLTANKRYYQQVFGQDADGVLLRFLQSVLGAVADKQRERLESLPVGLLVLAFAASRRLRDFAKTELLSAAPAETLAAIDAATSSPYAALQREHPNLERRCLMDMISSFHFVSVLEDSEQRLTISPSLVTSVGESGGQLLLQCQTAVQRCADFTDGAAFPPLAAALADVLSDFAQRVASLVGQLRGALGLTEDAAPPVPGEAPKKMAFATDEPFKVKLVMQLHSTAVGLRERLGMFDRESRQTMAACLSRAPHVARQPTVAAFAARLLSSPLMPTTEKRLDVLADTAETLVVDVLLDGVRARFAQLPSLPQWLRTDEDASPLKYVTEVGDHLVGLPDVIAQAGETGGQSAGGAVDWCDRVVKESVDIFVTQVMKIPKLSEQGAYQLGANAECFNNSVEAFEDGGAPALAAIERMCSATSAESFEDLLQELHSSDPRVPGIHKAIASKRDFQHS